jgi:hypothetical protein
MYEMEKLVWSQDDFDLMGWHDATVHAFALIPEQFELVLDIDYILKWEEPEPPAVYYTFWISPATLVFEGVQDIKINLDIDHIQDIDLQGIEREGPVPAPNGELVDWNWVVEANQGSITFRATGYRQYFRRPPIRIKEQGFEQSQRGGLSFERVESFA